MYQMQRAHGQGSFAGYERELFADVDAGPAVSDMRQYRGSIDPLSPYGSARPEGHTAQIAVGANGGSTGTGGIAVSEQPT
jgi:hypothetical protein